MAMQYLWDTNAYKRLAEKAGRREFVANPFIGGPFLHSSLWAEG
jgi:hypothetical protein